jgi:hypothetical protein
LLARVLGFLFLAAIGFLAPSAQATPQKDLDSAAEHDKIAFILVTDQGATGVDSTRDLIQQAMKQVRKSTLIEVDRSSPGNAELVAKCRLAGVPVPFILVTGRDGVPVGGVAAAQATSDRLVALVPSPKKAEVLQILRSGRAVMVMANRKSMANPLGADAACAIACGQLPGKCVAIRVDMGDPREANYLASMGVDLASTVPITLVINAQGEITGRYTGAADVANLVQSATKKSVSCCPPGSAKSCGPTK